MAHSCICSNICGLKLVFMAVINFRAPSPHLTLSLLLLLPLLPTVFTTVIWWQWLFLSSMLPCLHLHPGIGVDHPLHLLEQSFFHWRCLVQKCGKKCQANIEENPREIQVITAVKWSCKWEVTQVANGRWPKTASCQATDEDEWVTPTSVASPRVQFSNKHQLLMITIEIFWVMWLQSFFPSSWGVRSPDWLSRQSGNLTSSDQSRGCLQCNWLTKSWAGFYLQKGERKRQET